MIEKRRIWTDEALADYIRDELGFPGARQGAMVEKEAVDIATGEVSRERWYLLTSLSSRRCGPKELLRGFRNHWSVENSLHHVKHRSWDEDVHTLRRPGLGEVIRHPSQHRAERPAPGRMVSPPDVHAPASQDLRLPPNADHRPPLRSSLLTLQSSWPRVRIVLFSGLSGEYTRLPGTLSPELGDLEELEHLGFSMVGLRGPIPDKLGNLNKLVSLSLDDNRLSGPIPPEFGNLGVLKGLFLDRNILTGSIPPELGDISSLEYLNLTRNRLTGPIPPELAKLAKLRELGLSGNQLTGCIPRGLLVNSSPRVFNHDGLGPC